MLCVMVSIGDVPKAIPTAGLSFDFDVWTPGTIVELFNVPWNSDYRDIVKFPNRDSLDSYLRGEAAYAGAITVGGMTYCRPGEPVHLPVPLGVAQRYNYLRVSNPGAPTHAERVTADGKKALRIDTQTVYYYFINSVSHVAPHTTQFNVQLDVWQSFNWDVKFGRSFVERGHVGMADKRRFDSNGRDYLVVPEGLDIGNEYVIGDIDHYVECDETTADIMIFSNVSLEMPPTGSEKEPILETAHGTVIDATPSGMSVYVVKDSEAFIKLMETISPYPWVSQGIVSVMAVPPVPTSSLTRVNSGIGNMGVELYSYKSVQAPSPSSKRITLLSDFRNRVPIPDRYKSLEKFKTFPYMVVEVTSYTGTPLLLKPELINGSAVELWQWRVNALPNPRVNYAPAYYNCEGRKFYSRTLNDTNVGYDGGEWMDMMTGINNYPSFSVLNNSYLSFMASNRNSIAYQHSSADWSQQKALTSNSVAYGQATESMNAQQASSSSAQNYNAARTDLSNQQNWANAGLSGVSSIVNGAMHGGLPGMGVGALGAVAGAAQAGVNNHYASAQTGMANAQMQAQTNISQGLSAYNRDTNKSLADFAAKGDYANAIAGINARVQDAKLIQPTTSGQVGGELLTLLVAGWGVYAKVKGLNKSAYAIIGEYWFRYGYAVQRFMQVPQSLQVMTKFTYWKLGETYLLQSPIPEIYKQTIRGIFEKGVTVWTRPADIGTIDPATNKPIEGNYLP